MFKTKQGVLADRLILLFVLLLISCLSFILITLFNSNFTKASSSSPDFEVRVSDMLELSVSTCNSTNNSLVEVDVEPSVAGTFKSNCQDVSVNTNVPGYYLAVRASSTTLDYINPTTINPKPTIPSTANTIASPNILSNDTWGFAAEDRLNFDATYAIDIASNNYSALPLTDLTVYSETNNHPILESEHTFYYATKITPSIMAGSYTTVITYTAVSDPIPPAPKTCKNHEYAPECIEFTVDTTADGTYSIPTSGRVGSRDHAYDWDVYVDGYLTTDIDCTNGNCAGAGSRESDGIVLNNLSNNQHQIMIIPHGDPIPGWGNAFGYYTNTDGANADENKQKVISIDAPLTTMAFAPKTTETSSNASYMFAHLFHNCTNLTNSAVIIDTYKLPTTITSLSHFLRAMHDNNPLLTLPVDISDLSSWISNNTRITSFASFLHRTHAENVEMTKPINLDSLSGWFNSNSSITDLSSFARYVHLNNRKLTSPISLGPLAGWFNNNSSITDISHFLYAAHRDNRDSQKTFDLSPIKNWFYANDSIVDFSDFLYSIQEGNLELQAPIDLSPIEDWFINNNTIQNFSSFIYYIHYNNPNMRRTIDLSPVENWFYHNTSITDLSRFLYRIHTDNGLLTDPVDLSPVENWFYHNTSITNLSRFLYGTHSRSASINSPINLTPISNWFYDNNTITDLSNFMYQVHEENRSLTSTINLLPIKDWFIGNNSITDMAYFMSGSYFSCVVLVAPLDISPLSGWFNNNTSISNLTAFFYGIHFNNTELTSPINLTPLTSWFADNRVMTTVEGGFMARLHTYNHKLDLSGQIILPKWIMTMTINGTSTPIWDSGMYGDVEDIEESYFSFYRAFYVSSQKTNDSMEVKFNDASNTVLSGVGEPSVNRETYTDRDGIIPENINWK